MRKVRRRNVSERQWYRLYRNFRSLKRRDRYGSANPKDGFWKCPVPYPWSPPWGSNALESIIQIASRSFGLDFGLMVATQRLDRHRRAVGLFDPAVLEEHDRRMERDARANPRRLDAGLLPVIPSSKLVSLARRMGGG